jgi:hypothetical protein
MCSTGTQLASVIRSETAGDIGYVNAIHYNLHSPTMIVAAPSMAVAATATTMGTTARVGRDSTNAAFMASWFYVTETRGNSLRESEACIIKVVQVLIENDSQGHLNLYVVVLNTFTPVVDFLWLVQWDIFFF